MATRALYPGTFDPVTHGHLDLIERASRLFDHIIIAAAVSKKKKTLFDLDERVDLLKAVTAHLPNIEVTGFSSLLVDTCKEMNATVLLRGVRSVTDFDYELQLAAMNRKLDSNIETVFLTPGQDLTCVSSSLVREIASMQGDVAQLVPEPVNQALLNKFAH